MGASEKMGGGMQGGVVVIIRTHLMHLPYSISTPEHHLGLDLPVYQFFAISFLLNQLI